ncbi:serine hydrolase [Enterococcus larvae]|uniref:serine hydrolase n=1 Tax=Enterococcus larvae TaxID=2794352 RepID=UPI003F2DC410
MEKKKIGFYGSIFFICFFLIIVFFFSTHTFDYAVEQESQSSTSVSALESTTPSDIEQAIESNQETFDSQAIFDASIALGSVDSVTQDSASAQAMVRTDIQPSISNASEQALVTDESEMPAEDSKTTAEKKFYEQVQKAIDKASASFDGTMAITYVDLTTETQLSINDEKEFYTASTIKVPLAMMVADKVNEGVLKWTDKITYKEDTDYEEGTGRILNDIQPSYTLQTLQEYNITYSDNIAKNMLYGLFGGNDQAKRQLYRYFFNREADVEDTKFTSADGAEILLRLYEEKETNKEYQKIYDYMKKTVFHERLETSLTTGKVAHKIGSYDNDIHDIGILESSHPFILSVFTNGENGKEAISAITDQLWKLQEEQYPTSN